MSEVLSEEALRVGDGSGGYITIPVYTPENAPEDAVRFSTPGGQVIAVRAEDADDVSNHALRMGTPNGTVALAREPVYPATIVTSFESGNLNGWRGGHTAYFNVSSSVPTTHGSHALVTADTDYRTLWTEADRGDAANYYPQPGDTIQFDVNFGHGNDVMRFKWGREHGGAEYELFVTGQNDRWAFEVDYDTRTELDGGAFSFPTYEWVTFEIDWGSGGYQEITAWDAAGNSLGTLSATENIHTGRGIAIDTNPQTYQDSRIVIDNIRVI